MTTRDDYEVDYPDAITRLLSDYRTLSPSGVERIAHAWRRRVEMAAGGEGAERAAREAAEQAVAAAGKAATGHWTRVREEIRGEAEGRAALVSFAAEPNDHRRRAELAVESAALALLAGDAVDAVTRRALVQPAAQALPWLLPGEEPEEFLADREDA
jgi:hypothetical protein